MIGLKYTKIALILENGSLDELSSLKTELSLFGFINLTVGVDPSSSTPDDDFIGAFPNKLSAICEGLKFIEKNFTQDYVVVIVDCDGYHTPQSINFIAEKALKNPEHLILSRRSQKEKNTIERLSSVMKHLLYRRYLGIDVYCEKNCLKGFSSKLLPNFRQGFDNSYELEINFLLKCRRNDISVTEVKTKSNKPLGSSKWIDKLISVYQSHKNIIKFSCSSFVSFLVDYGLYTFLLLWAANKINFLNLTFANVIARIVSSSINFTLNHKFVFKSSENIKKSATQFFTLAAIILACNSTVLNFLANILDVNHYIAKILTEMLFFIFNYTIQNLFIFRKKNK